MPTAADRQDFRVPPGMTVQWVARDEIGGTTSDVGAPDAVPGAAALAALEAADLPHGTGYAFAAGEAGLATGARRHLVGVRGMPKAHIDFAGYWRHGRAAPG